jgi:hypothetical protein
MNRENTPSAIAEQIQVVWETLNGVMYDLTEGNPNDAIDAVAECIRRLENAGANQ